MSVSVERFGQGPDLVLLHGWGMNGAVWHGIAQELAAHYRLHLVDLPCFGNSPLQSGTDYTLPWLAEQVAAILPEKCHLLGWSLGGLVASQLALTMPERLHSLITVASSPCFMARVEWPGIAPKVLAGFNQMLAGDPATGRVERFLTGPKGGEVTGMTWSADKRTLFVGIQHPGAPFPDGEGKLPRSTIVAVKRDDNALVG